MQEVDDNMTSAVTIDFTINSRDAAAIVYTLSSQVAGPTSQLRNSPSLASAVNFDAGVSYSFVCPKGMMRAAGAAQCSRCPVDKITSVDQTRCELCPAGKVPGDDQANCKCELGSYASTSLPAIQCFEVGWYEVPTTNASSDCHVCPSDACLDCQNSSGVITLIEGYQLLAPEDDAPLSQPRSAFKCPISAACPAQSLETTTIAGSDSRLVAANCSKGHAGTLCGSCLSGWKKGPTGKCKKCSPSNSGFISPLFLVPFGVAIAYVVFRKLLSFQRERRLLKLGTSRKMFEDMDTNKSGALSRIEMRNNLALLGLDIEESTAIELVESIDVDHSGDIDMHEFTAWMEHRVSTTTMALVVAKIVLGLGQVVSKQPEVVKEEFPGPQW